MKNFLFKFLFSVIFMFQSGSLLSQTTAVLNFSPGGGLDISMRHFQKFLLEHYSIQVNFLFKPGAEGLIGLKHLSEVDNPDQTVGFTTLAALAQAEIKGHRFQYISGTRQYATVLVSNANQSMSYQSLVNNLQNGYVYSFGQATPAHTIHLTQFFNSIKPTREQIVVNYKGASNIVNDLIGGHIHFAMIPLASIQKAISNNQVHLIASTMLVKENIPTIDILDVSGYGIVFSTKASPETIAKWIKVVENYLSHPQTIKNFKADYSKAYHPGPEEMRMITNKISLMLNVSK